MFSHKVPGMGRWTVQACDNCKWWIKKQWGAKWSCCLYGDWLCRKSGGCAICSWVIELQNSTIPELVVSLWSKICWVKRTFSLQLEPENSTVPELVSVHGLYLSSKSFYPAIYFYFRNILWFFSFLELVLCFRDTLLPNDFSLKTLVSKFDALHNHEKEACLVLSAPVSEENVSKVSHDCPDFYTLSLSFLSLSFMRFRFLSMFNFYCNISYTFRFSPAWHHWSGRKELSSDTVHGEAPAPGHNLQAAVPLCIPHGLRKPAPSSG